MALLTINHVAASGSAQPGGTTLVMPVPAHSEWDLMVALVTQQNTSTITAPAGWEQIAHAADASQDTFVYIKWATADEPVSYTWTRGLSGKFTGNIAVYSNVTYGTPVRAVVTLDSPGTLASWPMPAVPYTGAATGLVRVDCVGQRSSVPATAWTPPGDMTMRDSRFTSGSGASYSAIGDRSAVAASPDPGGTWANNGSATSAAAFVSLLLSPRDSAETPPVPGPEPTNYSLWDGAAELPGSFSIWDGSVEVPATAEFYTFP